MIVRGYRKDNEGKDVLTDIFDIVECTYSGSDMGERSITATANWPSPINFQLGDYIELQMQSLERGNGVEGGVITERFYIYTMPTIKKTARPMTHGTAFEHNITFYPAQYELGLVQMRDMGDGSSADSVIYTGFDTVNLYCGANELMSYIMRVLELAYHDSDGNPLWSYKIANEINETLNTSLERFPLTFSGNTVMDALLKLNDKEGINTTFYINGRTIYVGFKRPYFCRVTDEGSIDIEKDSQMFHFEYGKTSHETIALGHGNLYDITKSMGKESPITKLFAYGAARNLNRYYCSDRLAGGRYVNRLMLPSFSNDGKTDFIISEDAVATYGIREASRQFEDIYPSLRYMTYGDIRQIKYCIKVKANGLSNDELDITSSYPIARVQCYRVIESVTPGVNALVEAAPPEDVAVFVHALGKVVKVVLCGASSNEEAIEKQLLKDAKVPTKTIGGTDYIPGSCFLVHDTGFSDGHDAHLLPREDWFSNVYDSTIASAYTEEQVEEIKLHQINYTDTFWLTDLYRFISYNQTHFDRVGYSAWAYPKLNGKYVSNAGNVASDSLLVNEIVAVEPIVIEDTSLNIVGLDNTKAQHTFDIYLRDVGFKIDEQNDFGENVFVIAGELKISILDGDLTGQEFEVSGVTNDSQWSCICAFNEDGTLNDDFFIESDYTSPEIPNKAFDQGAIWRIRCNRTNMSEPNYSNLNIALPNRYINAKPGDQIVLLDIFMPDIYIHAAENRLLRDARKYLYANDRGKVDYSVSLDKVRIQQIPNYALQMREGLNIRMVDDDLDISTVNRITKLFEGDLLSNISMYETTYDSNPTTEYYYKYDHRDFDDIKDELLEYITISGNEYIDHSPGTMYLTFNDDGSITGALYGTMTSTDANKLDELNTLFVKDGKMKVRFLERVVTQNGTFYRLTEDYLTIRVSNLRKFSNSDGFYCDFSISSFTSHVFKIYQEGSQSVMYCVAEYDIRTAVPYEITEYTPNTHIVPWGGLVYAPAKQLISFSANKHYEVIIRADHTGMLRLLPNGNPKFVLMNGLSGDALMYEPEYTLIHEDIDSVTAQFTFNFDLGSSFNDSQDYYPALVYVSDNQTEYVTTHLISVVESDVEGLKELNYADFAIKEVTIKITDSTNRTFAQPIKEITATLSEQNNASAWAALMNRVEKTENESDDNKRTTEAIIDAARRNYQSLLNLRDSIFDPDGTCTDTFLQVMMLQVGADSMNYYLDNTRQDANGTPHNYSITEENGLFHFRVYNEDRLHHIVYTEHGGTWKHIGGSVDFTLNPNEDGTYPTYFVAIKCKRYGDEGEWVCEPIQHKVNEEEEYYYFNWGILTADSTGVYTLMETRGNAYMYGDNLVCGKISSLAKNCWFDLTHGEFALGDNGDGTASLSYIDGVLTIGGIPDQTQIDEIIASIDDLNNQEIGGENLFRDEDWADWGFHTTGFTAWETILRSDDLVAGKYMLSGKAYSLYNGYAAVMYYTDGTTEIILNSSLSSLSPQATEDDLITTNVGGDLTASFEIIKPGFLSIVPSAAGGSSNYRMALVNVMLQKGTKATSYQPYVNHLTSALKGTTEIAGGLMMTNLLMLKSNDESIGVVAGMSGIKDDNSEGELGDGTHSEGVTLWGGGTYAKALEQAQGLAESIYNMLPVLLTKTGINSRIGCLRIVSSTQVAIDGSDDTQIIIDGGDEDVSLRLIKGGVEKIHITSGVISAISTDTKTISLDYSYNEGSWKVLSNVNEGGKTVNLATIPLSSSNYAVSYNCNYLKVIIGVHLSNIGPQVSNVKIKFGVYIGNYCIGYANASVSSLQTSSIYTQLALYVRVNKSMSNLSGGTSYGILIKDVSVTCVYGGSTRNMNCVLISMALGTGGNSSDTWVEGGTITLTTSLTDKVTIASNGVQVESSTGLVQIMNGKGGAYIKMFGLPESDSDLDEDQLYRKTVSFEDFKESLKTTLAEQYFSVKSGVSNAVTQLANKLPDSFDTVGIK